MTIPAPTGTELPGPRATRYGILRGAPFHGDPALPTSSEVVVIGGGICGVLVAWTLARRGIPVLLCEKAELACEASSRAFGWVSEMLVDPIKVPLARASKDLWRDIAADAGEIGLRQDGIAYLADSEEELGFFRSWLGSVAGIGDPGNRILTADEVASRYPGASRRFAGALFSSTDGSIEPVITTAAVARAAQRAGAKIVTDCAVRGLDLRGGRVAGVFTEKGHVATSTVLCAANTWSRLFCGNHGIDVPQIYAVFSAGRTDASEGPVGGGGQDAWAWRRQIDGRYSLGRVAGLRAPVTRDAVKLFRQFLPLKKANLVHARLDWGRDAWTDLRLPRRWNPSGPSPFEKQRVLSGRVDPGVAAESLRLNQTVFPSMAPGRVVETWAGTLPLTPDNSPIAGPVERVPGFYLMTALSFGFTWGPVMARMMADLMTGVAPAIDPSPWRLSRFFDGSPLQVTM
jgi:glycine/D-amino acid oxidase-like deaminating enzyme